jgi:drug/metabolite transporter (DMT)-like permease
VRVLAFCLLCLIWGFSWVAIKLTLEGVPPFLGAAVRFLVAIPLLAAYARFRSIPLRMPASTWRMVTITAILIYGLDYGLIYWAEQYLSAGVTAIFFATFPIFTGIFAYLMIRSERHGALVFLGLIVGFAGVFVIFSDELGKSASHPLLLPATIAVVAAAASAALATVLIKRHLMGMHPAVITLAQLLVGSALLLVLAVVSGEGGRIEVTGRALAGILYLGIVASALAFTLYYWLLGRGSAITVSTMIFITPVVALYGDWLVYAEPIRERVILGMGLIFAGIGLAELPKYREHLCRRRPGRPPLG